MSEQIEIYRAIRDQEKAFNRRMKLQRTIYLVMSGLPITSHNNGEHIVVANMVDFWPSSGLWIVRRGKYRRHGVKGLVAYCFTLASKGQLP